MGTYMAKAKHYFSKGIDFCLLGSFSKSIQCFKVCEKLGYKPLHQLYFHMALSYRKKGSLDKAYRCICDAFKEVKKEEPLKGIKEQMLIEGGLILTLLKRYDEALKAFRLGALIYDYNGIFDWEYNAAYIDLCKGNHRKAYSGFKYIEHKYNIDISFTGPVKAYCLWKMKRTRMAKNEILSTLSTIPEHAEETRNLSKRIFGN